VTLREEKMTVSEVLKMLEENPTVPLWPHAGTALGLKRAQAYKAAAKGDIKTVQFGGLKRVTSSWLRHKLDLVEASQ
jgi:hypothetical protein